MAVGGEQKKETEARDSGRKQRRKTEEQLEFCNLCLQTSSSLINSIRLLGVCCIVSDGDRNMFALDESHRRLCCFRKAFGSALRAMNYADCWERPVATRRSFRCSSDSMLTPFSSVLLSVLIINFRAAPLTQIRFERIPAKRRDKQSLRGSLLFWCNRKFGIPIWKSRQTGRV